MTDAELELTLRRWLETDAATIYPAGCPARPDPGHPDGATFVRRMVAPVRDDAGNRCVHRHCQRRGNPDRDDVLRGFWIERLGLRTARATTARSSRRSITSATQTAFAGPTESNGASSIPMRRSNSMTRSSCGPIRGRRRGPTGRLTWDTTLLSRRIENPATDTSSTSRSVATPISSSKSMGRQHGPRRPTGRRRTWSMATSVLPSRPSPSRS